MRQRLKNQLAALQSRVARVALYLFGKKRTLVFIFSAQRSGSTLLKALLAEGTGVSHLPEFRLERYGRRPLQLLYDACRACIKPIIVLKQPAIMGRESEYPRLHRLWRKKGRIIILYREPRAYLSSVNNAAENLNTRYRNFSAQERIYHWILTNQRLREQFGDANQSENVVWVSYEELTKNPRTVTRRLFRLIGAPYSDGVEQYRKSQGVEWDWGSDDGGELIRSLRVVPASQPRAQGFEGIEASLAQADTLYRELAAQRHSVKAETPPRFIDSSWLSKPKFLPVTKTGGARSPRILALIPLLSHTSWTGASGNKQARKFLQLALEKQYGDQITFCSGVTSNPIYHLADRLERTRHLFYGGPRYFQAREWQHFGLTLNRHLRSHSYDAIFLFGQFGWAGYLETQIPIVAMWDSVLQHSFDIYQPLKLEAQDQLAIHAAECSGMEKARTLVLPSQFSVEGYRRYVSSDDSKIVTASYGANLAPDFERPAESTIDARTGDRLELVFINSSWERKGGQIAVQTLHELRSRGIPVRLTLVGRDIPDESWVTDPDIELTGELRKHWPRELEKFFAVMNRSHVLIAPSRAEFVPGVIREANLFGIPCMASPTGAIAEMIQDGQTGWLVERNALAYTRKLEMLWKTPGELKRVAHAAYQYGTPFRWTNTAARLAEIIDQTLSGEKTERVPLRAAGDR